MFKRSGDTIAVLFAWYSANHSDFLRRPRSCCVLLGANASFQCSVQGYVTVYWCTTTSTRPAAAGVVECNLHHDFNDFNYTTRYNTTSNATSSRLRVPATTYYNGSRFKCCFIGAGRKRHCSRQANLIVVTGKACQKLYLLKVIVESWDKSMHVCWEVAILFPLSVTN